MEEENKLVFEKDTELYGCGYWSVCSDHACGWCPRLMFGIKYYNDSYEEMKSKNIIK